MDSNSDVYVRYATNVTANCKDCDPGLYQDAHQRRSEKFCR